jgi:integrase
MWPRARVCRAGEDDGRRVPEEAAGGLREAEGLSAKTYKRYVQIVNNGLAAHHAAQAKQKGMLGEGYGQFDLVLAREDGSIWKPESFTALYFSFVRRIGLKVRFHDLRHTHASQLLRAGISAKVVSERLGHSTVGITLDVYSHVLPGMQEEAANKVEAALRKAMEQRPAKRA